MRLGKLKEFKMTDEKKLHEVLTINIMHTEGIGVDDLSAITKSIVGIAPKSIVSSPGAELYNVLQRIKKVLKEEGEHERFCPCGSNRLSKVIKIIEEELGERIVYHEKRRSATKHLP